MEGFGPWIVKYLTVGLIFTGLGVFGYAVVVYFLRMDAIKDHFGNNNLRGHLFPSVKEVAYVSLPWLLKTGNPKVDRLSKRYVAAMALFIVIFVLIFVLAGLQ